ncbi:MAG TPA: hypothetical protein VJT81_13535 [Burkholderiales bacterium]|nr:hypothetical protein [Burkholderiales bacterium]
MIRWLMSRRKHLHWVLADQILVSGSNFAIGILYARSLGPASFGTYALIAVAQLYLVGVSVSLVGNPMITAAPHVENTDDRQHLIESSLAAQLLVSTGLALVAAAGMSVYLFTGVTGVSWLAAVGLAASSFGLSLLEWFRRLCFLHRDGPSLFRFDALVYPPVVIAAFALTRIGWFTVDMAVLLWGISSVAACSYAAYCLRIPRRLGGASVFLLRHWRASRDFVVSFQAQWLGSQGLIYVAAPLLGNAGVGALRSIAGLLGFTNALGTTADNILPLKFAQAYASGGRSALKAYALSFSVKIVGSLLILIVFLFVFSDQIVLVLLGPSYLDYSHLLGIQGISVLLMFVNRLAMYYQRAVLNTRSVAIASFLNGAFTIAFVYPITRWIGVAGPIWTVIAGAMVTSTYLLFEWQYKSTKP